MHENFHNLLLLTGAGFTQNYGGFLAREMWARIYNNPVVQRTPRIRDLLQDKFDFEAIYADVFDGPVMYSVDERHVLQEAIEHAYADLDDTIREWVFNSDNPTAFNTYGLGGLFSLFNGSSTQKGLFFTLNQDLMMEREYQHRPPGSPQMHEDFRRIPKIKLERKHFVTLSSDAPTKAEEDIKNHTGLLYIKLHGSYGWLSADGRQQMVLGKNKPTAIEKEPLLKYYFDLFHRVISRGDNRILIIGYGFQDEHINRILLEGVKEHGLRLYVISSRSPDEFRNFLEQQVNYAFPLWKGMYAYFPYTMRQIFPPDQQKTVIFNEIKNALLA